ncbi:hypothetical protein NQ315_007743 [Exocentrus adspersus]|uniref:Sortilin-related receptor n=1 Tax=Exocentrus adspersus TaxID=1586481 RepID=A0AAV8W8F2_9CUCU|nr:hypothetical protein NQ315_007743 [Exocentrus adspersus]
MVHWVGEKSKVVICLARDPTPIIPSLTAVSPSAVYISYDDGDKYENKTDSFKLENGSYATLEKFYNHPKYNTHFVFTDIRHNLLYVTKDHGKAFKRIDLDFTPSDVSFHELQPSTFVVLDKNDTNQKLWITEDFGENFRLAHEFVKAFYWMKDIGDNQQLLLQRSEPNGLSTIIYSKNLFKSRASQIYTTNVKDFFFKGDYLFTTKINAKGELQLYVSYKLGKQLLCVFESTQKFRSYYIVDVTGSRAFVAVSHSDVLSNLYVSENLGGNDGEVRFTLSLPNVFAYFPNTTWQDTWLHHLSEDAFTDMYKVEGLTGIYVASKVITTPVISIGPKDLASVITFDHGATWRRIQPPAFDVEGQSTGCLISNNCSLHLSQKFSQLHPETRHLSILSRETRHILYSIDEGENWNKTMFHNEDMRLYGLMTEPGENSTVFTMFGSLPEAHQWIIVKVDFEKVFNRTCTKDDYKMWSPSRSEENRSYIPCVLGQQTTYERRMPLALCLNGLEYERTVSKQPCDCDVHDYECDFGFVRVGKPPRCIFDKNMTSYDPYKVPASCKPGQFYNRTKGYRKISGDVCIGGFESHYLPDQVPCPFQEVDDFIVFAQKERISRYNLQTKTVEELPVKNLKNVIATDFDMSTNCVYWADIAWDTIGRQCFANGSKVEILVSTDLASVEGMAIDWISKTLYFVDGVRAKIELIRTDINHSGRMRRTILDGKVLTKPRAENPSVNRANMDGSNNITLFGRDTVEWPNGITIDYFANRIYWVDAKRDYIGSADLHGDGLTKVVSEVEVVSHPFAIAVFKNNMYWDDWKRNSIFSADKDTFRGVEVIVKQLPGLMDLKVFAHGLQIGSNACTNSTCPYICVGMPKNKFACLCPDGLISKNGECLCPGDAKPLANLTCPQVDKSCSAEHFGCESGLCIPKGWKCDGEDDCGDNSDEEKCGKETCPVSFFVCGDGKCVPSYWRCDYDKDCADGSDENNCPRQNCTGSQFACENGRCISSKWRCDGENDCRDNSDERNCNIEAPKSCKHDEFHCQSGETICIPSTWKCDGEPDCRDGSDEASCTNNTCSVNQFSCGPPFNRCIYLTWVCDGDNDCSDGEDEANCTTEKPDTHRPNNNNFDSKNGTCQDWMFKCKNERCIPFWWRCDTADDCGDGSDEVGCQQKSPLPIPPTPSTTTTTKRPYFICETNQFQCLSGHCILSSYVCDGMRDCPGGDDESHCDGYKNCTSSQFRCRVDGSCVELSTVCDGVFDCPDETDELVCRYNVPNVPATPSCSSGMFPCDGNICYPLAFLCDGKENCADGYDERNCSKKSRIYQVIRMMVDERGTTDNSILLHWWKPVSSDVKLEFLPSISKVGENKWKNATEWTENLYYKFTNLEPFTEYNMTVYVRLYNTSTVFPPANYFINSTSEGVPSAPWNVSVAQKNGSHVLLSWMKPLTPQGIIRTYDVIWKSPDSKELALSLIGDETSHTFSAEFLHNVTYTFWVVAYNSKYKSPRSEPVKLLYDGETNIGNIEDLKVVNSSDEGVSLAWNYEGRAEGFNVMITTDWPYPRLAPRTTKTKNIALKLAPGARYQFEVYAFKNNLVGPTSTVTAKTPGITLPKINNVVVVLHDDLSTVKLSWERPKYVKDVNWLYGVYYGIKEDDLFEKPAQMTTNETALVKNLDACEIYMFAVGLVGPIGFGPLSNFQQFNTSMNEKAPPKNVRVGPEGSNPLRMTVEWSSPCPIAQARYYLIKVVEKTTTLTSHVGVNGTILSHVFNVSLGGVYEVSVTTSYYNATYSKPVIYRAPPLLPPYEIQVVNENNGSYVVYWQERELPASTGTGKFQYEVLVQEGRALNESTAQRFVVAKPPFVYTNSTADIYTFAVRIKTAKGLRSVMSELISRRGEAQQASVNLPAIIVPSLLVLIGLVAVIGFLVVRNRRLQSSFTRFANSHYDTRSEAATFDDNSLEEDDSPQIRGFSDDEPLVIA